MREALRPEGAKTKRVFFFGGFEKFFFECLVFLLFGHVFGVNEFWVGLFKGCRPVPPTPLLVECEERRRVPHHFRRVVF